MISYTATTNPEYQETFLTLLNLQRKERYSHPLYHYYSSCSCVVVDYVPATYGRYSLL